MTKIKQIFLVMIGLLLVGTTLVLAKDQNLKVGLGSRVNLQTFGQMAIQHEGRIKPLETFARTTLLQFSGKRTFDKKQAIAWLAKLLFTPWETLDDKIFLINSPEIPMAINIEPDQHRRYSFNQLQTGLPKIKSLALTTEGIEEKKRSLTDQEIIRLYNNISLYLKLQSAVSFALPHGDFLIAQSATKTLLDFPQTKSEFSFFDIALRADQINEETKPLEKKKSDVWTATDKELMKLLRSLYQWSINAGESPLTIMPALDNEQESWGSPWDIMRLGFADAEIRKELTLLQDMSRAYAHDQTLDFAIAVKAFNASVEKRSTIHQKPIFTRIPIEYFYNQTNPFFYAWFFYLLAFFTFIFSLIWPQNIFRIFALSFLILGFIPHIFALIMRTIIMSRPPVTNLYETFIFVGVVTVLLSLITEIINRQWLGIVVGSIGGFASLAIADKFSAEGDTLRMLVAVLNSNFWLSTHVLSITIGYAGCCVAGIMGHVYILQALFQGHDQRKLDTTYQHTLGILGFGLTMTFLGTMLGGIWADQSWGRFWGWDPKENGALLIVLWTAMIFHARTGRMIKPLGVAVGSALCLIVVMWAWFGVNLLSIGLHSYGFTSGIATNLAIYVGCEFVFLAVSVLILGKRNISI